MGRRAGTRIVKILAFLQNPWFKPGTNPLLIKKYRLDQDFHRRVLYMSATGRALYRAFGPELYREIIWENANWRHGDERDSKMPPDATHMAYVITMHRPELILCFGEQAKKGIAKLAVTAEVLYAYHPMARGSYAEHLSKIVEEVKIRTGGK